MNNTRFFMTLKMVGVLIGLGFAMCFANSADISKASLTESEMQEVMDDDLHRHVSLMYDRINNHDESAARILTEYEEMERAHKQNLATTRANIARINDEISDSRERWNGDSGINAKYNDMQNEVENQSRYMEARVQQREHELEQQHKIDEQREARRRIDAANMK